MVVSKEPLLVARSVQPGQPPSVGSPKRDTQFDPPAVVAPASLRFQVTGGSFFDAVTGERVVQFYDPCRKAIGRPKLLAEPGTGTGTVGGVVPRETWKSLSDAMEHPFSVSVHTERRTMRKFRLLGVVVLCLFGWSLTTACIQSLTGNVNYDATAIPRCTGTIFLLVGIVLMCCLEHWVNEEIHEQTMSSLRRAVNQRQDEFETLGWRIWLDVSSHRKDDVGRPESFLIFEPVVQLSANEMP